MQKPCEDRKHQSAGIYGSLSRPQIFPLDLKHCHMLVLLIVRLLDKSVSKVEWGRSSPGKEGKWVHTQLASLRVDLPVIRTAQLSSRCTVKAVNMLRRVESTLRGGVPEVWKGTGRPLSWCRNNLLLTMVLRNEAGQSVNSGYPLRGTRRYLAPSSYMVFTEPQLHT